MLTENQTNDVWNGKIAAEVRAMYFGDLASAFVRQKQIITGASFFLSSGAAATIAAKMNSAVPILMSIVAAILTAYSIAVGLDKKAATMAKLQTMWSAIAEEYDTLWNHWYEDQAEAGLRELARKGREASELASTEAPYDEKRVEKWREFINRQYDGQLSAEPAQPPALLTSAGTPERHE